MYKCYLSLLSPLFHICDIVDLGYYVSNIPIDYIIIYKNYLL